MARRRLPAAFDSGGAELGTQAALRHHARVPAHEGSRSARHDAPHRDGAGQLRLLQRSRRNEEAYAVAQAVTHHSRHAGQLTLQGGQARRHQERARRSVVEHGSVALRLDPEPVDPRQKDLPRLRRVGAGRRHVLVQARGQGRRQHRPNLPRLHQRRLRRPPGHPGRLEAAPADAFPRSPSEEHARSAQL